MTKPNITHERLLDLIEYDPDTGNFFWRNSGKVAGFSRDRGYRMLMLDRKQYQAARVAWFYVLGEWPERTVRFRNGDPQDCRFSNLRYGEFHYATQKGRNAYDRSHRERNPDVYRYQDIKRKFGLTKEQYDAMVVAQGGMCAICGQPETQTYRGRKKWLSVDHNHESGQIRGLLCSACNLVVGHSAERPEVLRSAAVYLEKHEAAASVVPLRAGKGAR